MNFHERARASGLGAMVVLIASCVQEQPERETPPAETTSECSAAALAVVEQLGQRMRLVSLLAPSSTVAAAMNDAYGPLVTVRELTTWQRNPTSAPGRETSNPWPARIAIRASALEGDECRVDGDVAYVTTSDTTTVVDRKPVRLRLRDLNGWRVTSYEATATPGDTSGVSEADSEPGQVVRRYYRAIQLGEYEAAYLMWADSGRASRKSLEEFKAGFAGTAQTRVTIPSDVTIEGAAGSRYANVPVQISAVRTDGQQQRYFGTYTLRRSVVDGATAEQRSWRIQSAQIYQQ